MKFNIHRKAPSLNKLISLEQSSRWAHTKRGRYLYYKARKNYSREAWLQEVYEAPEGWDTSKRKLVTLTRVMGYNERKYDDDNFIGGLKPLRDALVDAGLIANDNARSAEFKYEQVKGDPENEPMLTVEVIDHPAA